MHQIRLDSLLDATQIPPQLVPVESDACVWIGVVTRLRQQIFRYEPEFIQQPRKFAFLSVSSRPDDVVLIRIRRHRGRRIRGLCVTGLETAPPVWHAGGERYRQSHKSGDWLFRQGGHADIVDKEPTGLNRFCCSAVRRAMLYSCSENPFEQHQLQPDEKRGRKNGQCAQSRRNMPRPYQEKKDRHK